MSIIEASHLTGASEYPVVWAMSRHHLQGKRQVAASWTTYHSSQVAQVIKNQPAVWETWFDPWSGRFPGGRNGNPLQYSCLGNPMDRGAWRASPWGRKESDTTERLNWTELNWAEEPPTMKKKAQCFASFSFLEKSILKYRVRNVYCYPLLVLSLTSMSHHIPICNCWICSSHINRSWNKFFPASGPLHLLLCHLPPCFPFSLYPSSIDLTPLLHNGFPWPPDQKWVPTHNLIVHFRPLLMSFMT